MARPGGTKAENEGGIYLSLRMASEESVTPRLKFMRLTIPRSISLAVLAVLMASSLSSTHGGQESMNASAAAVDISDRSANVVVEVSDNVAFQEVVGLMNAKGAKIKFSNEETGVLSIESNKLDSRTIDRVSRVPGVLSISSEKAVRALFTPNDDDVHLQWGLGTVNAYEAWDITRGNHSVVVAVLDTGIDWNHPDLAANMWDDGSGYHGYNVIAGNRLPMDDNVNSYDDGGVWIPDTYTYHGTHVAGVVGAVINNNLGVAGMAQAQLMAVKVMNDSGEGTDSYVASGIRWAVDNGADIITMSLGVDGMSTTLNNMINYASNHGVVMVAASGNSGSSVISYPAAYPKVIAVGAVDSIGKRASFSNYGNDLDVMAPGVSIFSTQAGASYQQLSGTSTAAPFVAGLAALMLTVNPALTPEDVGDIINSTAQDISIVGHDPSTGWGIIDAFAAVEQVASPTVTFTEYPDFASINSTFSVTWMVSGGSPGVIEGTHLSWGTSPTSLTDSSATFTGQTWASFTVTDIPSLNQNGTLYLKAYATVDGSAYESDLLEMPVHEAPPDGFFAQFLNKVEHFIVDDIGVVNFLILLAVLIAVPAIAFGASSRRRRIVRAASPPSQLHQYQAIPPDQYLPPPPPPPPRFETYVDLVGHDVMPATLNVIEGTKIVWINRSWAPPPGISIKSGKLDAQGEHPDGMFQSGVLIAPGDYWSATFHQVGTYDYYITGIWKAGKIIVEPITQGAS
jgi:subtilisin family serine protease